MGNTQQIFSSSCQYCAPEIQSKFSQTKKKSKSISAKKLCLGLKELQEQYYVDKEPLGSGSFGKVYRAISKSDPNKKFAIKTINKKKLSKDDLVNVYREVHMLIKLDHPNIIKYYETYEESKYIYLVMELLDSDLDREQKLYASKHKKMSEQ